MTKVLAFGLGGIAAAALAAAKEGGAPAAVPVAALSQVGKITLTTFLPKRIGGANDSVKKMLLGTLIGRATDTVQRKGPDGDEVFTGLAGSFEARLTNNLDGSPNSGVSSSVLFMPQTFQGPLLEIISDKVNGETGEVLERGADAVGFAFNIHVQRAANPNGYEWVIEPLYDATAQGAPDPLADLRKLLPATTSPTMIEGPKETPAE